VIQRLATFNVALARRAPGQLTAELDAGSRQARAVAAIIRHVRPDILVLNEFDYDPLALELFRRHYLEAGDNPLALPYSYTAPVNTGIPSGHDLDRDGATTGPGDALGYGTFPGQYGMALLSAHPIDPTGVRSFQRFPWQSLPGASLPTMADGSAWYPPSMQASLPLSSKSHWDIPIQVGESWLHCLVAHPTPPTFDGPERRNYYRNRDEIRFWRLYLDGNPALVDDAGIAGGATGPSPLVVMGDLNADALAGAGDRDAIAELTNHQRLQDPIPRSHGAPRWQHASATGTHPDPARMTSWLGGFGLRLDYVLPDRRLPVTGCGVFWPPPESRRATWIGSPERYEASDHRLVWVDVELD
jgi:endonuclease/exonuclease/phosphatase family metal-dependent hydrolase